MSYSKNQVEEDKQRTEGAKLMFESIIASFGCFTFSIMLAVRLMVHISGHVSRRGESVHTMTPAFVLMMWSFFAAIHRLRNIRYQKSMVIGAISGCVVHSMLRPFV